MRKDPKPSFKSILSRILWAAAATGFLFLFFGGIRLNDREKCREVLVRIVDQGQTGFLNAARIRNLVIHNPELDPLGRPLSSLAPDSLELLVEKNPWVARAKVYVDDRVRLHIDISQKIPLARIFTLRGTSFFLDTRGERVPLMEQGSARVPVFTGYPLKPDSLLKAQVTGISRYLAQNPFWNAQISQIQITPQGWFEFIPEVGDQVIVFGDGSDMKQKFENLFVFYRKVLGAEGWNKYDTINIAYRREIVCTRADTSRRSHLPVAVHLQSPGSSQTGPSRSGQASIHLPEASLASLQGENPGSGAKNRSLTKTGKPGSIKKLPSLTTKKTNHHEH